jgi:hypothetical protein
VNPPKVCWLAYRRRSRPRQSTRRRSSLCPDARFSLERAAAAVVAEHGPWRRRGCCYPMRGATRAARSLQASGRHGPGASRGSIRQTAVALADDRFDRGDGPELACAWATVRCCGRHELSSRGLSGIPSRVPVECRDVRRAAQKSVRIGECPMRRPRAGPWSRPIA